MSSRPRRDLKTFGASLLLLGGLFVGCQSAPPPAPPVADHGLTVTLRNNSYALLYQLMGEEKDVSLLRFIKREHQDLKDVLKEVSKTSAAAEKLLKKFAEEDPTLDLNEIRLPPGEMATRAAIAAHDRKNLLHRSGEDFEMTLLLTQAEAVNYGDFLARVAAQNESVPGRRDTLEKLSQQMAEYHHRIVRLIAIR
jgi:hypothetical protein